MYCLFSLIFLTIRYKDRTYFESVNGIGRKNVSSYRILTNYRHSVSDGKRKLMGDVILFIFSGLPAVGKSALAKRVATDFGAAYLRIDTIEQGLRDLCGITVEGEGYRMAYRIAEDNLRVGRSVVADCCNPVGLTRVEWETVARTCRCAYINIEVVCSDKAEHRRRAEQRTPEIARLRLPRWEEIAGREYHRWQEERIVIDTAGKSIAECRDELARKIADLSRDAAQNPAGK